LISVYKIKPAFQNLLRPVCRGLAAAGVTANAVTVFAMLLSFGVGACILWQPAAKWPLLMLPILLFVRMALNAIDGMLAREHGMKSDLGAILNELGDVLSDVALYLPLAWVEGFSAPLVVVFVVLAVVTEFVGVLAPAVGAERRYDGPMGKSDRAFVLGALALGLVLGLPAGTWVAWLFVLLNLALVVTVVQRARKALREGGVQ
jgi:CDP-diacylglycerol--glycerol-3-phosphate 3-phosphatidyltransferase